MAVSDFKATTCHRLSPFPCPPTKQNRRPSLEQNGRRSMCIARLFMTGQRVCNLAQRLGNCYGWADLPEQLTTRCEQQLGTRNRQLSVPCAAKSAHQIDDQTDQQNQTKSAATDDGSADVKPAAAKQEK